MHWFRFASLVIIVTLIQAGFLNRIAIARLNVKPDLLLILLVFFALYGVTGRKDRFGENIPRSSAAIITSFALGFAADIIASPMGPRMITFGLIGSILAYLHRFFIIRKMSYQAFIIFLTAIVTGSLVRFLIILKGQPPLSYNFIFFKALYSAVISPLMLLIAAWWMNITLLSYRSR